jgi:hypothetical protein
MTSSLEGAVDPASCGEVAEALTHLANAAKALQALEAPAE